MTNLDSILKSRDITLLTKVLLVKAMVFPVVMYGFESWTIKKAEPQRIDAFELWCWRRLLRVPWTAKRSNEWILKEISPEYSLEGLMLKLKLKLKYFGQQMWRTDPDAGKDWRGEGDNRGWDGWMVSLIQWRWIWVNSGSWWWTGRPGVLWFMGLQRVRHDWVTELNWTEEAPKKSLVLSPMWGTVKRCQLWTQKTSSKSHYLASSLTLLPSLQNSEQYIYVFLLFIQSMAFCYSSMNRLRNLSRALILKICTSETPKLYC